MKGAARDKRNVSEIVVEKGEEKDQFLEASEWMG
jgi:hypothetical protein